MWDGMPPRPRPVAIAIFTPLFCTAHTALATARDTLVSLGMRSVPSISNTKRQIICYPFCFFRFLPGNKGITAHLTAYALSAAQDFLCHGENRFLVLVYQIFSQKGISVLIAAYRKSDVFLPGGGWNRPAFSFARKRRL
jgi:hypothetical protein